MKQSFLVSIVKTQNHAGSYKGVEIIGKRKISNLVLIQVLLLLSSVSLISSFTARRVERAASPSPHSTAYYYTTPYYYSYYPYSNLLWGRKKRSASPSPEPYYGGYRGYYRRPYYRGYYRGYWGRKKRSASPEPFAEPHYGYGGYGYGYSGYRSPYYGYGYYWG